jgi:hypothetical protein
VQLLDANRKESDEIRLEVRNAGVRVLEKSSNAATGRMQ